MYIWWINIEKLRNNKLLCMPPIEIYSNIYSKFSAKINGYINKEDIVYN